MAEKLPDDLRAAHAEIERLEAREVELLESNTRKHNRIIDLQADNDMLMSTIATPTRFIAFITRKS